MSVNAKYSTPAFVDAMTWNQADSSELMSNYQEACEQVAPGFHPRVPQKGDEKQKGPNAKFSTPAFVDAMTWSMASGVQKSTYQSACDDTCGEDFVPRPPPAPFEEEGTEGDRGDDDESTQAPLYYAWNMLPPPAPTPKKVRTYKLRSKEP